MNFAEVDRRAVASLPPVPCAPAEADAYAAAQLIVVTDGPSNVLEGTLPDRRFYAVNRAEMHCFPAVGPARARAMVYPGGGYLDLVHDKEGVEIAQWLAGLGVEAYVVTHRLPGARSHGSKTPEPWPADVALRDSLACLERLESMPALPMLHVGLSSGGHLAGVMACQRHIRRPVGLLIGYAPINANHRRYKAPPGKPDYAPLEKQDFYDAWPIGMACEPHGMPEVPTFLVYALHDQPVPIDHALNFIKSAQAMGRDVEAHIYAQAPHGFALRDVQGTHDQWPALAARWMDRVLQR